MEGEPRPGDGEGLRAWVSQIDRRVTVRSSASIVALVLALAVSIVAAVLAFEARDDSATKAELTSLRDQVSQASAAVSKSVRTQLQDLSSKLDELSSKVDSASGANAKATQEISVLRDDVTKLHSDVNALQQAPSGSKGH